MGDCPPWRGGSPFGSLTAHFQCQQGAYTGKRLLYKLQNGRRQPVCNSVLPCPYRFCFIGEMKLKKNQQKNPNNQTKNNKTKPNRETSRAWPSGVWLPWSEERSCPSFLGPAVHVCPPQPVHGAASWQKSPGRDSSYLQGYLFLKSHSGALEGISMPPQTFLFAI